MSTKPKELTVSGGKGEMESVGPQSELLVSPHFKLEPVGCVIGQANGAEVPRAVTMMLDATTLNPISHFILERETPK
jgi:hypothetical protein